MTGHTPWKELKDHKRCTKCDRWLPKSEFYQHTLTRLRPDCKRCCISRTTRSRLLKRKL